VGLAIKVFAHFAAVAVALAAGLALVVALLVFSRGTEIINDGTFIGSIEIVAAFIPIASALVAIPNAIREHRKKFDQR
jgi:hypothetical protein